MQLLLTLLMLACVTADLNLTETNWLPGQSFLGHGYNALYANPLVGASANGGAPEGLTKAQSVIAFKASDDTVKWNGNSYVCPAGVDCDIYSTCGAASTSFSAHGAKSMQETLQTEGGVGLSVGTKWIKGSFTASAAYTKTVEEMEEHSYSYYYVKAVCAMYNLKMRDFSTDMTVTDEFKNGVAWLDVTNNDTFFRVIGSFGTHYTSSVMMGGQFTKVDVFESDVVASAESKGVSFEEMASVSFGIFSANAHFSVDKQTECKEEYDDKKTKTDELYVGGAAFEKSPAEWYKGLVGDVESVAPTGSMEVTPIHELLTATYFPDDKDIAAKAGKMKELLESYCEWFGAQGGVCVQEPEDKIPPTPPGDRVKKTDLEGGPKNQLAAEVAIGTKVYRFGGWWSGLESTATRYDAVAGTWDEAAVQTYPQAVYRMGAVAVGTDIYLFGGKYTNVYSSTVRQYDTTRDSYATVSSMDKVMDHISAASVTVDNGSQTIYYGSMRPNYPGLYQYDHANDKHAVIDTGVQVNCLASSSDDKKMFGVVDKYMQQIDSSTGSLTKVSGVQLAINNWNQCAMTNDGFFYFLTNDGIWFMDTAEDGDKKWYKAGVVARNHTYVYSAVMIQDTLLITSNGFTDAFDTTPTTRATATAL